MHVVPLFGGCEARLLVDCLGDLLVGEAWKIAHRLAVQQQLQCLLLGDRVTGLVDPVRFLTAPDGAVDFFRARRTVLLPTPISSAIARSDFSGFAATAASARLPAGT